MEEIESLRKKQLRKIQVEFPHSVKSDEITCTGIIAPEADKNILNFMFSGNMKALLGILDGKEVSDLIIEEPTLGEIFMHYYSDEAEQGEESKK